LSGARSSGWLAGVRRAGKTCLCQSLPDVEYFDCELPSTRHMLESPEAFLRQLSGRLVVLDEIHRLDDPSQLLKIAADHYPSTRIIATGSSALGASARFRDTLAGRKSRLWLTPMLLSDLVDFGAGDLPRLPRTDPHRQQLLHLPGRLLLHRQPRLDCNQ
jgi:predicted AAA+ superfamily ATPase